MDGFVRSPTCPAVSCHSDGNCGNRYILTTRKRALTCLRRLRATDVGPVLVRHCTHHQLHEARIPNPRLGKDLVALHHFTHHAFAVGASVADHLPDGRGHLAESTGGYYCLMKSRDEGFQRRCPVGSRAVTGNGHIFTSHKRGNVSGQ